MDDSFTYKGTEMKSLEHIIREITARKRTVKEEEPVIQSEMNLPLGTDKYQGSQFKQVTPHIKPPGKTDGHSQQPENVSAQRNKAKAEHSATMKGTWNEEEQLDEVVPAVAAAAPYVAPALGGLAAAGAAYLSTRMKKMPSMGSSYDAEKAKQNDSYTTAASRMKQLKAEPSKSEAPPKQEIKPGAPPPILTQQPPKAPEKLSVDRPSWPDIIPAAKPATAPPKQEVKPATPPAKPITGKEVEVPAAAKPATDAAAPAVAKPGELAPPVAKVGDLAPATTKVGDIAKTADVSKADTSVKTDTATKADAKVDTKADTATKADAKAETAKKGGGLRFPGLPFLGKGFSSDDGYKWGEHRPVGTTTHKAMKHKVYEEDESKGTMLRRKIVNVGRPCTAPSNFDPRSKLSKQSEIKTKIIDEAKKIAGIVKDTVKEKKMQDNDPVINGGKTVVYPQVIINPPIKHPDNNRDT
jgi:hypothetical protein